MHSFPVRLPSPPRSALPTCLFPAALLGVVSLAVLTSGCQTLREVAALERVDFSLRGVQGIRLAGIDLRRVRSISDISPLDVARVSGSLADGGLPLDLVLDVEARNPVDNPVRARLVQMEWTFLVEDREIVRGVLAEERVIPPGETARIAVPVNLDVRQLAEGGVTELLELGLALVGLGGQTRQVGLRILPTIDTPLGPMRYPRPITILGGGVGGPGGATPPGPP